MKKIGVLILTIALLSTALCSAFGASALDAYLHDGSNPVFSLDLSDEANASKVGKEGITAHAYDTTEEALKVYPSAASGKAPARLTVTYGGSIATSSAPVIAVVYKGATDNVDPEFATRTSVTSNLKTAGAKLGETTSTVATYGVLNKTNAPSIVDLGNGYKLLVADVFQADAIYAKTTADSETTINPLVGKTSSGSDITMIATIVDFFPYSSTTFTTSDAFYVKSVALFDTINSAKLYYGAAVENYKIVDFDSAEDFAANSAIVTNSTASSFAYDADAGAALVTPNTTVNDGASLTMKPAAAGVDVDPSVYPYISIKVKLADASSELGQITGYTGASAIYEKLTEAQDGSSISTNNLSMKTIYAESTDWQIITVNIADCSVQTSKYPYNGYSVTSHTLWQQIILQLSPYNKADTAGELYWIEWIGFFREADDAAEYDRMTDVVKYYGVQNSSVGSDSKYDMRFISTIDAATYDSYDAIGMTIIAVSDEGTYDLSKEVKTVYSSIKARDGENNMIKVELDGKYLVAVTVGKIPLSAGTVTYTITPYVMKDNVRYTGDSYTVSFIGTDAKPEWSLR